MKVKVKSPFIIIKDGTKTKYEVNNKLDVSNELYEKIKCYVEIINTTKKEKSTKVED